MKNQIQIAEEMLTVKDLAKYLKVNPQTIYNWVSKKEIPYIKIGDLVRFKKSIINEWIKSKEK